jgi:uncharacterized protein with PQ loop repeat
METAMELNLPVMAGVISTVIFAVSTLPMLVKAARTKDLSSYSLGNILLANVGNLIHSVYVFNLPAGPVWVLHTFYLVSTGLMLIWYTRYVLRRNLRAAAEGSAHDLIAEDAAGVVRLVDAEREHDLSGADRYRQQGIDVDVRVGQLSSDLRDLARPVGNGHLERGVHRVWHAGRLQRRPGGGVITRREGHQPVITGCESGQFDVDLALGERLA